jgi:hypothetical protein
MLAYFLVCSAASEVYPLLLGVPKQSTATTVESLAVRGTLPANLAVIIVDHPDLKALRTLADLSNWASAAQVCESFGKVLTFPAVDAPTFDFLDIVRRLYPSEMKIDAGQQCTCALKRYAGGLLVVRIPENDVRVVSEVVQHLPKDSGIAFISATQTLFRH